MSDDRFKNYDEEVRLLVLDFEYTILSGENRFFDIDEFETIIDYYLEVCDEKPLIKALDHAENLYPDSVEIKLRRAQWYITHNNLDQAFRILAPIEDAYPDNTDVSYTLAIFYSERGDHERAIDYYLQAASDGWQVYKIYSNIAEEYYAMYRYDKAIEYYRLSLSGDEFDSDVLYLYVDTCEQVYQTDSAADFLNSFTNRHPYCKEGWFCLGHAYHALGLYDRAVDAIEYAIAIDKHYLRAYKELSSIYEDHGRIGEAATALIHMLDASADRSDVFCSLGQLFFRQNNIETALDYFRHSLDEDPSNASSLAALALCYYFQGDLHSADSYANRSLNINNRQPDAIFVLAMLCVARNDDDKAIELFDILIQNDNASDMHFHFYTIFLNDSKHFDLLLDFTEEMHDLNPDNDFFSTYLASAYFHTNHFGSLQKLLPKVNLDFLFTICPEMWDNKFLVSILPPINQHHDNE